MVNTMRKLSSLGRDQQKFLQEHKIGNKSYIIVVKVKKNVTKFIKERAICLLKACLFSFYIFGEMKNTHIRPVTIDGAGSCFKINLYGFID